MSRDASRTTTKSKMELSVIKDNEESLTAESINICCRKYYRRLYGSPR